MNKLILLLIPLTLAGASCTLPEKFVAAPTASVTANTITGHHLVLDMYSNRDENDNLSYREQVEVWYSPDRGARIDFYSFDESGQPFLAHRMFDDIAAGQAYTEMTASQIDALLQDAPAEMYPVRPQPHIDELKDEAQTLHSQPVIASILDDVFKPDYNWVSNQSKPYVITQETTEESGYSATKRYTIDHETNQITQVEEYGDTLDRPFSRMVVTKREMNQYDPSFFTLDGWRKSLADPNLPLESELLEKSN